MEHRMEVSTGNSLFSLSADIFSGKKLFIIYMEGVSIIFIKKAKAFHDVNKNSLK